MSGHAFGGPLDRLVRWHLFYDGDQQLISVLAQGTGRELRWSSGPAMETLELTQADSWQARLKTLAGSLDAAGRGSIGIVLHLADGLSAGIVQESFENPEQFVQARSQVRETPSEVVTDLSTDPDPASQWRYYPLLSAKRAVVLHHRIEFLTALEPLAELDIKVTVHCAPIEMLSVYLRLYLGAIKEKPHCFVFFYDRLTLIALANQEGLLDIKVLTHHGQAVPPTFGDDLFSRLESLGFASACVLLLVPCGTLDPGLLFNELDAYARKNQKNAEGIDIQVPDKESVWRAAEALNPNQINSEIIQRPEFLAEYAPGSWKKFPLSLGITSDVERFGVLSRETFWPDDKKTRDRWLPRSFAIAIALLGVGRIFGVLCLVGLAGWLCLTLADASKGHGDSFQLSPETVSVQRAELGRLQDTKEYLSKWNRILAPRSQAWSVLDFFMVLLPEGQDIVCERLYYTIKQGTAKRPGGNSENGSGGGFQREWDAEGYCNESGRAKLERLRESAMIAKLFDGEESRLTDASFAASADRELKVILREEVNPQFGSTSKMGLLPYQFRLGVTQLFGGNDPLAIPVLSKPK